MPSSVSSTGFFFGAAKTYGGNYGYRNDTGDFKPQTGREVPGGDMFDDIGPLKYSQDANQEEGILPKGNA